MMNQDQFHAAQSDKWATKADPEVGWNGVTKATPLKVFPAEEPNRTDPEAVISQLRDGDKGVEKVNLNNVPVSEAKLIEIFDAMRHNEVLTDLSMSNCTMGDFAAANLACALENNKTLEKLSIESNNVSPQTLVKIFEAANVQQTLKDIKASNQQAQFLGNKVEVAITNAVEKNKTLLRVGLHFEFGDCRNRVAVHLQKNLDRQRLKRIAHKLSSTTAPEVVAERKASTQGSRTGGLLGGLPRPFGAAGAGAGVTSGSSFGGRTFTEIFFTGFAFAFAFSSGGGGSGSKLNSSPPGFSSLTTSFLVSSSAASLFVFSLSSCRLSGSLFLSEGPKSSNSSSKS